MVSIERLPKPSSTTYLSSPFVMHDDSPGRDVGVASPDSPVSFWLLAIIIFVTTTSAVQDRSYRTLLHALVAGEQTLPHHYNQGSLRETPQSSSTGNVVAYSTVVPAPPKKQNETVIIRNRVVNRTIDTILTVIVLRDTMIHFYCLLLYY